MIAKVTRGCDVRGLAAYLHGPGKAEEHVYAEAVGGAVIGGTLGVRGERSGQDWAAAMGEVMAERPEAARPVWHLSLRQPEGERELGDREWRTIAAEVGESMGWAEHPWVAVRHGKDHIHVVVSRVGFDGALWHGHHDYRAAMDALRQVERDHHLSAPAPREHSEARLRQGEWHRGVRTGQVPPREELAKRVRVAVKASAGAGRAGFEAALEEAGVEHRANVAASTGRVSGYSLHLPGHTSDAGEAVWFRASALDRALSWSKVEPVLSTPVEPAPIVLRSQTKRWWETKERVKDRARAQEAAERLARVPGEAAHQVEPLQRQWHQRHQAGAAASRAIEQAALRAASDRRQQEHTAARQAQIKAREAAWQTAWQAMTPAQRQAYAQAQQARRAAQQAAQQAQRSTYRPPPAQHRPPGRGK